MNTLKRATYILARKIAKIILPIKYQLQWKHQRTSFSQDGEDLILEQLLIDNKIGFYVDIGAHHPFRFSNTYKFYSKGWNGINIDASPTLLKDFDKYRERDINLNYLVSNQNRELSFYIFNEQALNTTEKDVAEKILREHAEKYQLKEVIKVKSKSLGDLLDNYLPQNQEIDFMSIDCEGHDLEVLMSNNWIKYKPKIIVAEIKCNINELLTNKIYLYLNSLGYKLVTKNMLSSIFCKI